MFGKGLLKGLQITMREFWTPKFTVQYPEQQHPVPERFHGKFKIDPDACISCGLCVNACPNKVISLKKEKVGKKQYLTEYRMDIQYCLFCGLCVESCNKDALKFTQDFKMCQYHYDRIPLMLVKREAPPQPVEEEEPADKAEPKAGAKAAKAKKEVAAGKAPDKEGQE